MAACTLADTLPLDAAFLDSPEARRLLEPVVEDFPTVPTVRFRSLAWPAHVTNLLRARYGVAPEHTHIATLAQLLFEDLRGLRRRDQALVAELYEELVAFYTFLARVRPASNACVVLAWLMRPSTAQRLSRALLV